MAFASSSTSNFSRLQRVFSGLQRPSSRLGGSRSSAASSRPSREAASFSTQSGPRRQRSRLSQQSDYGASFDSSRILRSSIPDVKIPHLSFVEHLLQNVENVAEKTAMVCGMSGRSYTYEDVQGMVERIGSALTRRGFRKGDVFAIISPNIPEFVLLYMGVASVGGIVTTANPLYTSEEIARQLNDCNAKFVMTIPHCSEVVLQAVANCPSVQESFIAGEGDGFTPLIHLALDDGTAFPNVSINPAEDILCLPYSSGTTGHPKGVLLTHQNVLTNVVQSTHTSLTGPITDEDTFMALLPLFHIYSMVAIMATGINYKCKLVTLPRFEPEMFINAVREYKPTIVPLVPPIISFLAKSPLMKPNDFDSVHTIICGAAPLGHNVCEAFLEKIYPHKVDFIEGYGMTETSPVTLLTPKLAPKLGFCGVVIPNTEAKVVDINTGEALGPMQPGELMFRGPQVMKGYHNNSEATNGTLTADGWIHTGDIAVYDEDEYFKIIDRLKELIKVKGLQVSPSELEDLLMKHPSIQDAAVIGIPDSRAGELPRAYIVRREDTLSEDEVASFIEGQVAPHKAIKGGVEFVKSIPKTQTGKILHRQLRQQYMDSQEEGS